MSKMIFFLYFLFNIKLVMSFDFKTNPLNPLPISSKIKTNIYDENDIYSLNLTLNQNTIIIFENDEEIGLVLLDNRESFIIKNMNNDIGKTRTANSILFIKPTEELHDVNMTIFTNKRIYNFQIEVSSSPTEKSVYTLRFFYPERSPDDVSKDESTLNKSGAIKINEKIRTKDSDPTILDAKSDIKVKKNLQYSYAGSLNLVPNRIFDDGRRTFLDFENKSIPSIHYVDTKGKETLLKLNTQNNYVAIDGVYPQLSLRLKDELSCIFNDNILGSNNK